LDLGPSIKEKSAERRITEGHNGVCATFPREWTQSIACEVGEKNGVKRPGPTKIFNAINPELGTMLVSYS
jgi:hypothetical protein